MQIATQSRTPLAVGDDAVAGLRASFRGALLRAGDPEYDQARRVFNGMFDRRPALIARCRDTADVVAGVRFARERGLLTVVRSGGHSIAGLSTCDDGFVIDLSEMRTVSVDPERRRARVGAGATWGEVDARTQPSGLAAPGGIVSHTGVAGLTLGGGIGWLRNKYGFSSDNLLSAEMVTAAGDVVRASERENPDLLWALRGGGGRFGVVTELELALHPVGPTVAVVFAMYPLAQARNVLRRWREWLSSAPDEASTEVVLWTAPASPDLPPAVHGREIAIAAGVYAGDPEEGLGVLQPLREIGDPLGEIAGALPYCGLQQAFDPVFPNTGEVFGYWKSLFLRDLDDTAIEIMADRAEQRSSPSTMVFVQHLGGAIRRVPRDATAFAARDAAFVMNFMGDWRDAGETPRHVAWVREAWDRLAPFTTGAVYPNFLGAEEHDAGRLAKATYGANYDRLEAIKARYDPGRLFRGA